MPKSERTDCGCWVENLAGACTYKPEKMDYSCAQFRPVVSSCCETPIPSGMSNPGTCSECKSTTIFVAHP